MALPEPIERASRDFLLLALGTGHNRMEALILNFLLSFRFLGFGFEDRGRGSDWEREADKS